MTLDRIRGKMRQIGSAGPWTMIRFFKGWAARNARGSVPCRFPETRGLCWIPLNQFYNSYAFFCEAQQGREEIGYFLKNLPPGGVFLDVGGFYGAYSVAAAAKGFKGEIHCFEPMDNNASRLGEVLAANEGMPIRLHRMLVGAGGETEVGINAADSMFRKGDAASGAGTLIASVRLDDFCRDRNLRASVIKIDVDGFEDEVLRGAAGILEHDKPLLWIEVHPGYLGRQGLSWSSIQARLEGMGYAFTEFKDASFPSAENSYHVLGRSR
jgi:FkbM family methyltransferase